MEEDRFITQDWQNNHSQEIQDKWDLLKEDTKKLRKGKSLDWIWTEVLRIIKRSYSEGRYYHTLGHVLYMLKHINDFNLSKKDKTILELAVWFHDVVYVAKSKQNEYASTIVWKSFAKQVGFKKSVITEVSDLIMITTHKGIPSTYLERVICDLDLRVFTSKHHIANSLKIRKEFYYLSDKVFYYNRHKFLKRMLNGTFIYNTSIYRNSLEAQARINLREEMELLSIQLKTLDKH